ncbi:MAG: hypothetical protein D6729_14525, partial [Deltaproteobacteria bacterium]
GRGGSGGLVALLRVARRGTPVAFAVDGGHGPVHTVHGGVVTLARLTGRPVVPVGGSARPRLVFRRAWDRFLLPLPFARVAIVFGPPQPVPRAGGKAAEAAARRQLAEALHAACRQADARLGIRRDPAALGPASCPRCAAVVNGARQGAGSQAGPPAQAPDRVHLRRSTRGQEAVEGARGGE